MSENGAPNWIRTSDLCLRRATLYPAELWVQLVRNSLVDGAIQHLSGQGKQSIVAKIFTLVWGVLFSDATMRLTSVSDDHKHV